MEVRQWSPNLFIVRDSKQNHLGVSQPHLLFDHQNYTALLAAMVDDQPHQTGLSFTIHVTASNETVVRCLDSQLELRYDADEIDAFRAGIKAGEFEPQPFAFAG